MKIDTFIPGWKAWAPAVLLAGACTLAHGGVIILVNSGTATDPIAEDIGHSFTTPGGGGWNNIAFNFFSDVPAITPLALGDAFLFTQEYLGTPGGMSSSTPGFLAESTGISGGQYIFASSLVLNANSEYWLYVDTPLQTTGNGTGGSPAQQAYFVNDGSGDFCICTPGELSNFELDGTAVAPEPGTWLTGISGLVFVAGLKLRRRRSPGRGKSQS